MSYAPVEDETTIWLERYFLAGDCISGTAYGIQLMFYWSCARYLWRHRRQNKTFLFLLAYITLLISIETIFVIVQANTVQLIYVDNRNYPGGPWQFFLATQNLPVNVMFFATLFVLTFLSDLLVLWRCWVIWTSAGRLVAYLVIAFPSIVLLASFVMGTLWTLQSSHPGLSMYAALPMAYGTSYYAISLGINIVLTLLITLRLLLYRRRLMSSSGLPPEHAKHYLSLAAIFIESAALYSVWSILFLITYAVGHPSNQIWLGVASGAQQVSGYLIIYRVAEGRAWSKDSLERTLPTIQFKDKLRDVVDSSSPKHSRAETLTNLNMSTFQASYRTEDSLPPE